VEQVPYHPAVTRIEVLRPFVEQTMKAFLGVEQLEVLEDGTIPIRAGSTAVNVQLIEGLPGGHPLLRVSSPVLHDVSATPELLAKLNDLNASLSLARAYLRDGVVVISMELLAESLDEEQIANAYRLVSFAADHWDDELQRAFGGSTFFGAGLAAEGPAPQAGSDEPKRDEDPGGYL
jgi:type III secretion system-like peptide-binding chaperone